MPKLINLTGQTFGRLTVISEAPRSGKHGYTRNWHCVCECGETTIISQEPLRYNHTQSCGCLQRERAVIANTIHGLHGTPAYRSWQAMINRCRVEGSPDWKNYGGRGITVCDSWKESFVVFFNDMGQRPIGDYSIDRINNDGNYEPGNCRWADRVTQNNNTRRKH